MTVHNLTTKASRTFHDLPAYFDAVETLRIGTHRYAVGGWTSEGKGRIAYQGPQVQGPHTFAYGLATVLSAHPMKDEAVYVDVKVGDHISIAGNVWLIEAAPNQNIALTFVLGDKAPGCGKECRCHDGSVNCWHADPETSKPVFARCDCEA